MTKSKMIFNIQALVSVEIRDKTKSNDFYLPQDSKVEMYRSTGVFDSVEYSVDDLIKGRYTTKKYIVENKTVFDRPSVTLTFMSGKSHIETFDTYELAMAYGEDRAKEGIRVRLEVNPAL